MDIDLQVNGGNNLNFNDVKTLDDFLSIELSHIKKSKNLVVPTFITDNLTKLDNFVNIINERQTVKWLPRLNFIHIEGFFITNRGAHAERYLLVINEENIRKFGDILVKLNDIKIIFTIAIELLEEKNIFLVRNLINLLKNNNVYLLVNLGHSLINSDEFCDKIKLLNKNGIKLFGITHFHNAIYGGHFTEKDNIGEYLKSNLNCVEYIGLITDGHHTDRGELLPTLFAFYDKIVIVSDASSASCYHSKKQKLYELGGHINVFSKPHNKPPAISFIDFFKNDKDKQKLKIYVENGGKIEDLYFNVKIGYKNLAGSAVNLKLCKKYLNTLDIVEEIKKTVNNKISLDYLIFGISRIYKNCIICEEKFRKINNILTKADFSKNNINYLKIHFKKILKVIYKKYLKHGKFFNENIKINVNNLFYKKGKFIDLSKQFSEQNYDVVSKLY
jgi:hypothetical protein